MSCPCSVVGPATGVKWNNVAINSRARLVDLKHRVERYQVGEGRECSMSSRSLGS